MMPTADHDRLRVLRRHLVWDNHGCMPIRPKDETFLPQLERYRASGINVVTLNVAWDGMPPTVAIPMLATLRRWIDARPRDYMLVESVEDLDRAKASSRLGVLFDIEGGCALQGHLPMVKLYYDLGVRWMLLAYNRRNELAGGCLEPDDQGLTVFGEAVIGEMCSVGMVPCCSHVGPRTALEILSRSTLPVIFSHSNAWSIWNHPRNISDEAILACARTGGVIGLNGCGVLIGPDGPKIDWALKHIRYISDLVGPAHVGLGIDYVFDPHEIADVRRHSKDYLPDGPYGDDLPTIEPEAIVELAEGLMRMGWSDEELAGFLGLNLRRVAARAWKPVLRYQGLLNPA